MIRLPNGSKKTAWVQAPQGLAGAVVSSRVRLIRNLAGIAFPECANSREREKVISTVLSRIRFSCSGPMVEKRLQFLEDHEKQLLVERRLLRPSGLEAKTNVVVLFDRSRTRSVVVNDEDHVRIQVLSAGLSLQSALVQALAMGKKMEEGSMLSRTKRLGYLTASPANVGSGLRTSVLLHLPALVMTQEIVPLVHTLHHMELSVRGFFGQALEMKSPFFLISNRVTLGKTELELIRHLEGVAVQLGEKEAESRSYLLKNDPAMLEDRVRRASALVKACTLMEEQEALDWLSLLMLGVELDLLEGMTSQEILEVLLLIGPASLQTLAKRSLQPGEQKRYRATLVQRSLKKLQLLRSFRTY